MNLQGVDNIFLITEDGFELNPTFQEKLQQSNNPMFVSFQGKSRSGKSTRLNHLLTRNLRSKRPFISCGGQKSVTKNFQYFGPISLNDFGKFHGKNLSNEMNYNPDIFLIDAEGMEHIDGSSKFSRKAMFTLSQISSINILVLANIINQSDIRQLKSFFGVNKMLKIGSNFKIETGIVIIQRAVGISFEEEDFEDGSEKYDAARKSQDYDQKPSDDLPLTRLPSL
jgi:hypothetical protein